MELEHDPSDGRREARTARLCWGALVVLMALTLLGVFGEGPLSRTEARDASGRVRVEYDRFGRFGRSMDVVVHAPAGGRPLRVGLSSALLRSFSVERITPPPASAAMVPHGVEYVFDLGDAGSEIRFDVEPVRRGRVTGTIRAAPAAVVRFSQFIYP